MRRRDAWARAWPLEAARREVRLDALGEAWARHGGAGWAEIAYLAELDAAESRRAEAARWAAELARVKAQQAAQGAAPGGATALDRAAAYLRAVPGGEAGAGRSDAAWRVTLAMVRGFGLGLDAAPLLLDGYAPRCSPRWSRREIEGMVRRAVRATRCGWGWMLVDRR